MNVPLTREGTAMSGQPSVADWPDEEEPDGQYEAELFQDSAEEYARHPED
jgi:hypothetical protein